MMSDFPLHCGISSFSVFACPALCKLWRLYCKAHYYLTQEFLLMLPVNAVALLSLGQVNYFFHNIFVNT